MLSTWYSNTREGSMVHKRRTDPKVLTWYRTDRMVKDQDKWFFHTRENTTEGPFKCEFEAQSRLETYIKLQASGILTNDQNYSLRTIGMKKAG